MGSVYGQFIKDSVGLYTCTIMNERVAFLHSSFAQHHLQLMAWFTSCSCSGEMKGYERIPQLQLLLKNATA